MFPNRLAIVNRNKGTQEVLTPTEYLQRGTAVLLANANAVNARPQKDIQYPHWSIRYVNQYGGDHIGKAEELCNGGIAYMLSDRRIQVKSKGKHWSAFNFFSKEVVDRKNKAKYSYLGTGNVATIFASAQKGTILMLNSCTAADIDIPGQNTPRLYNSELMYQAWRDTCSAYPASKETRGENSRMKDLRFIVRAPIVNQGTFYTIEDVFEAKGLFEEEMLAGPIATFSSSDERTDAFRMLVGTANGQPVARMCADHAESLGGKQVVKVHVWYEMPMNKEYAALIYELA